MKRKAVLFGHFVAIDYGDSYGTSAVAKTWSTAGLYHLDGTPKPVLADWKRFFQLPYSPETLP